MKIEESYSESNLTRSECFVAKILKLQQNMEFPNTLLGTGGAAPRGSSPLPATMKFNVSELFQKRFFFVVDYSVAYGGLRLKNILK